MAPPLVHRAERLTLGSPARIAVVADTHSSPHPAAAERLRALRPAAILHAGDIGDLAVLDALGRIAPVLAVRGNIDTRGNSLPDVLTIEIPGRLRILMTHIAVYGPKLRADVARLAVSEDAHLVVCGHSHVPFIGRDRGIPMFNPGSIGPRRFSLPIVFGTIELGDDIRLAHWDVVTGEAWAPPG
ncbi:MAG: metallophosphoesterase family protein [Deltaproteobacteria bacterium]|nr:metallophosphoesterase family protein [Deltaproteobacteria bacterium]